MPKNRGNSRDLLAVLLVGLIFAAIFTFVPPVRFMLLQTAGYPTAYEGKNRLQL